MNKQRAEDREKRSKKGKTGQKAQRFFFCAFCPFLPFLLRPSFSTSNAPSGHANIQLHNNR
jgi:hypothetical protein